MDFSTSLYRETTNPTALDNFAAGYFFFDRWANETTDNEFVCLGDGVWKSTTTGGGGGASILDDLLDVTIGPLARNQMLRYDDSTTQWTNQKRYQSQYIISTIDDLLATTTVLGVTTSSTILGLETNKIYAIDGDLDISGYTIKYGQRSQINGIGQNVSTIRSSTNGVSVADPYVMFDSDTNLFMNSLEIYCEGSNQLVWKNVSNGTVPEGESFELNRFAVFCFESPGHNNKLGFVKDIRQGFMGTMFFFGFEDGWEFAGTWTDGGFRISNTLWTNCSGKFYYSSPGDPVVFERRFSSNAAINVPAGSIGYDFPSTSFTFTGQYQLQNGNASGAGTYVSNFASGFPAFDPLANFRNNSGIQDTFQGGEWIVSADQVTTLTQNVWTTINVTTTNKFLTWFDESNGVFNYRGGTPLDVTINLVLGMLGKNNDVVEVRILKEDALAVQTVLLSRAITLQGNTSQGRAQAIPLTTTDQLVFDDDIIVQIRNLSGNTNITVLEDSNCVIGAK